MEKDEFNKRWNYNAIKRIGFEPCIEELISTTQENLDRVNKYLVNRFYKPYFDNIKFNKFCELQLSDKLQKIFGEDAKNINIYEAKNILKNEEKFDFVEGIMKQ